MSENQESVFLKKCLTGDKSALKRWDSYMKSRGDFPVKIIEELNLILPENASYAQAQTLIGELLIYGVGLPRDINSARVCYEKAASLGNARAMCNLARLLQIDNPDIAGSLYFQAYNADEAVYLEFIERYTPKVVDLDKIAPGRYYRYPLTFLMMIGALILLPLAMAVYILRRIEIRNELPLAMQKAMILTFLSQDFTDNNIPFNYSIDVYPLLYDEALALIDKLPDKMELTEKLIHYLIKKNEYCLAQFYNEGFRRAVLLPENHLATKAFLTILMQYPTALKPLLEIKYHFSQNEDTEGLKLYKLNLFEDDDLSAIDFFHLGNAELIYPEEFSIAEKIGRLEMACHFFHKGFLKGDTDCYDLMIQFLRERKALQESHPYLYRHSIEPQKNVSGKIATRTIAKIENQTLLTEFLETTKRQRDLEISALSEFIQTQIAKSPPSKTNPSIALAQEMLPFIKVGCSLSSLILMSERLNRLKGNDPLYSVIKSFLPPESIVDETRCKEIVHKKNSGQIIYEALVQNKPISSSGLKILAQNKAQVLKHIKTLPKDQQQTAQWNASQQDTKLHQFLMVQRGMFKPRKTAVSFKEIEQCEKEQGEDDHLSP